MIVGLLMINLSTVIYCFVFYYIVVVEKSNVYKAVKINHFCIDGCVECNNIHFEIKLEGIFQRRVLLNGGWIQFFRKLPFNRIFCVKLSNYSYCNRLL